MLAVRLPLLVAQSILLGVPPGHYVYKESRLPPRNKLLLCPSWLPVLEMEYHAAYSRNKTKHAVRMGTVPTPAGILSKVPLVGQVMACTAFALPWEPSLAPTCFSCQLLSQWLPAPAPCLLSWGLLKQAIWTTAFSSTHCRFMEVLRSHFSSN